MSSTLGTVGKRKIAWKRAPSGSEGAGEVTVDGKAYSVAWKRDADGLWIEFPHGTFGYDFYGEADDSAGGLVYRVNERGTDRLVSGVRVRGAGETAVGASGGKKKATRVRAQMPGKIVRVLVKAGDEIAKDQPLLVMEAMKMENEIRATGPGKVGTVKVTEGQAVESGADLILID
ncbi:MAG: biotin/lipoyl-binding protein [Bdellovibrionales bacterium]|nr:biotin/lipoyl-binding protein [Bdellovibrionales bacterium]